MIRSAVVLVVGLLLCAAPAADGQALFGINTGSGESAGAHVTATYVPVTVSGDLTVEFHGDQGSGCASAGLCGYSGTITWDPGRSAILDIVSTRSRHGHRIDWTLDFGDPYGTQTATRAEVDRVLPGGGTSTCGDVSSPNLSAFYGASRDGMLQLGPGAGDLDIVGTRCAGPLASDVAKAMPAARIAAARAMLGNQAIDLSGARSFASHGFAGTVASTLHLHTGRAERTQYGSAVGRRGRLPFRILSLSYRVVAVRGELPVSFSGLADPDLCGPLDACGLLGTLTVSPAAGSGDASIDAIGPRRVSRHDLRVALGLAKGRGRGGIEVSGSVEWKPPAGTVTTSSDRGGAPCNDSAPLRASGALLATNGRRLTASYLGSGLGEGPTRTRCPGPELEDVAGTGLASGSLPLSALRRRELTLQLTSGFSGSEQGYQATARPNLTIVLRRTSHPRGQEVAVIAGTRWVIGGAHAAAALR